MGLNLQYEFGQTPLELDELEDLRIHTISTKYELDEFEQQNIEEAMIWVMSNKWKKNKIISEPFILELHKRMYKNVWKWAGSFRKSEKNIGVPAYKISIELKQLLDDTMFWIKNETYLPDEIAIRFKHRLVAIHCFPNGNGRHSRLMADIIIEKIFNLPLFSWGINQHKKSKEKVRKEYISAIREADKFDIQPLLFFART